MFDHDLFLGLPLLDSDFRQLSLLTDSFREAFIQNNSPDYLQQIESDGKQYLGKCVKSPLETSSLDSIEAHITSLLKMLFPEYSNHDHPLVLLAIANNPTTNLNL